LVSVPRLMTAFLVVDVVAFLFPSWQLETVFLLLSFLILRRGGSFSIFPRLLLGAALFSSSFFCRGSGFCRFFLPSCAKEFFVSFFFANHLGLRSLWFIVIFSRESFFSPSGHGISTPFSLHGEDARSPFSPQPFSTFSLTSSFLSY